MSALATSEPASVTAPPKAVQRERIPARVRHACDLLASGECATIKAAAERVNLSREHLSRMISKPHVQMFIEREARRTIAMSVGRASIRMRELMDDKSGAVSFDASRFALGVVGIRPPETGSHVSVGVNVSVGYVIDLTGQQPARAIEHSAPDIRTDKGEQDQC